MITETPTIETQVKDFSATAVEIETWLTALQGFPATVKSLQNQLGEATDQLTTLRRQALYHATLAQTPRLPGTVTDNCAREVAAVFILHCAKSDKLEALSSVSGQRDTLLGFAKSTLNVSTRAAITTTDIPLTLITDYRLLPTTAPQEIPWHTLLDPQPEIC
jgi:hypothetical protein